MIVALQFSQYTFAMDNQPSREEKIRELSQIHLPKNIAMGLKAGIVFACQHLPHIELEENFNDSLLNIVTQYYMRPYKQYIEVLSDEHLNDLYQRISKEKAHLFAERLINCLYLPLTEEQESIVCEDFVFPHSWLSKYYNDALAQQKNVGLSEKKAKPALLLNFKKLIQDFGEQIDETAKFKEKYPNHDADLELLFKSCQKQCLDSISVLIIHK